MRRLSVTNFSWIFKFLTTFEKQLLRVFATSTSSDMASSVFNKVIFSLDLPFSERKALTVCQNFLLSVIFFFVSFRCAKYSLFTFLRSDTQKFLSFVEANLIATIGFFKKVFLIHVLSIMGLDKAIVMKGLLFPRRYFFFLEHDAQVHSSTIQKIIADF